MRTNNNSQAKTFMLNLVKLSGRILFTCLLLMQVNVLAQNDNIQKTCIDCHQSTVKKDILHGPAATSCISCHESNGKEHPLEDVAGFTLFEEGAQLCYSCHLELEEERSLKYIHKPVKNGECMECHEVHSSNNPKLVFANSPDMCFFCHSKYDKDRATAKKVHTASYEGIACARCHTPHASKEKRLLTEKSKQLCLNCHNKEIKKSEGGILVNIGKHISESSHIHKALNKRCTSCHNAHYSSRELMLKENFPIGMYAKGVEENFTLCFDCHDVDLLNLEKTTTATLFRNGDQNLHYLHVNKEKGRNCTSCHDMHAADNAQIIATTVKFGRWDMPIKFIPNENGGSCKGCHEELFYAR